MPQTHIFGFEAGHQPMLGTEAFARRLLKHIGVASLLILPSLVAGIVGYHYFEGMSWLDAFANAAMILSGMGPLEPLKTSGGKLFAGLYALWSGLVLVVATGVVLAPIVHRVLHRFHVEAEEEN
jgi:hypothetical protein